MSVQKFHDNSSNSFLRLVVEEQGRGLTDSMMPFLARLQAWPKIVTLAFRQQVLMILMLSMSSPQLLNILFYTYLCLFCSLSSSSLGGFFKSNIIY